MDWTKKLTAKEIQTLRALALKDPEKKALNSAMDSVWRKMQKSGVIAEQVAVSEEVKLPFWRKFTGLGFALVAIAVVVFGLNQLGINLWGSLPAITDNSIQTTSLKSSDKVVVDFATSRLDKLSAMSFYSTTSNYYTEPESLPISLPVSLPVSLPESNPVEGGLTKADFYKEEQKALNEILTGSTEVKISMQEGETLEKVYVIELPLASDSLTSGKGNIGQSLSNRRKFYYDVKTLTLFRIESYLEGVRLDRKDIKE